MSSLYPDRPYQGSPFKRFSTKYNSEFNFNSSSSALNGSPRRTADSTAGQTPFSRRAPDVNSTSNQTLSHKSPARPGITRNRPNFSPLSTRRAQRSIEPQTARDSPIKLRPTSARLARQAEGILSTLDSSSPLRSKRNIANGSPGYNQKAVNRYAEREKENIPKRRKVVKFDDNVQELETANDDSGLGRIVLDLQKQVQQLQRDHSNAITRLQETVESQAVLIEQLMQNTGKR